MHLNDDRLVKFPSNYYSSEQQMDDCDYPCSERVKKEYHHLHSSRGWMVDR